MVSVFLYLVFISASALGWTHTHTHTHAHTNMSDASTCVYTHTCSAWGHKPKQETKVFQEPVFPVCACVPMLSMCLYTLCVYVCTLCVCVHVSGPRKM